MKKEKRDYDDWYVKAIDCGIDWENDPPPPEFQTEELCRESVVDAPANLGTMPLHLRTRAVCEAAVLFDDDAIEFVPESLREEVKAYKDAITPEEWLRILTWEYDDDHNRSLKLTKKLQTPEFCRTMVEYSGYTLDLVPEHLKTPELVELAKSTEHRWKGTSSEGAAKAPGAGND